VSADGGPVELARLALLAAGFAVAAVADIRKREIDDRLWQVVGLAGVFVGVLATGPSGTTPLLFWLVASAFALEHLFPWDDALGPRGERFVVPIEIASYLAVLLLFASAAVRLGVGGAGVPLEAIATVVTVVLARGLFELGVLYGGADAKAVIVAGTVLPVFAVPLLPAAAFQVPVLDVLPFSVTVLTNAAVLSVAIPLGVALRNVARGDFSFPRGFTGYWLPVRQLPRRFVWVRDEQIGEDSLAHDVETSEEDTARRRALARELEARGIRRVWVSPQIPFVVLIGFGVLSGVAVGNILLELFRLV
jgi:hypothetical protein